MALWLPCTKARAQAAMSRCVSDRNQCVMIPRGVPHRTQNTVDWFCKWMKKMNGNERTERKMERKKKHNNHLRKWDCQTKICHHTEFELTVELLPVPAVPANRVEANGEFSTGRLHASSDHGALSYILDKNSITENSVSNKANNQQHQ